MKSPASGGPPLNGTNSREIDSRPRGPAPPRQLIECEEDESLGAEFARPRAVLGRRSLSRRIGLASSTSIRGGFRAHHHASSSDPEGPGGRSPWPDEAGAHPQGRSRGTMKV